jgi:hypothetical protein
VATSPAVLAARQRRTARAGARDVRIEWYIDNVAGKISLTMRQRVGLAVHFVKSRVVQNISRPVTKTMGKRSGQIIVTNRSKKGEFPKADTTQLMKTIFESVMPLSGGGAEGYVGTPLDYGLELEIDKGLDRSFLARTLREEKARVIRILTGPIK